MDAAAPPAPSAPAGTSSTVAASGSVESAQTVAGAAPSPSLLSLPPSALSAFPPVPVSSLLREGQVAAAVSFLQNPNVASSPPSRRIAFLENKVHAANHTTQHNTTQHHSNSCHGWRAVE